MKSLINHGSVFKKHKSYKVRLLLKKGGEVKISSSAIKNGGAHPYITLAKRATDSRNIFLHHKTTNRKLYDDEYLKCKKKGFIDIIFCNERGEVTEGAISNIIIKNGRYYYTPPASCGLLNGAYRQHLLNAQTLPLKEKVLYKKDIITAEKLFICNSVRGLAEVRI